jgi:hypothetical protein
MVRFLLTLCYALTALPGPGLCCCTFRPRSTPARRYKIDTKIQAF